MLIFKVIIRLINSVFTSYDYISSDCR
ncbi:hypothetical protein FGF67_09635 [Tamlana fucoidanivorans]|uniref:Uncharacterized protein n=1 Tax=Allotamlana fucoidanivorans TaxID=2583814 RepID=A0A5C4SLP4_9FLAO|nr:hypothetical protein FGF67_09635 [Tamlana fucoidanivorans]